MQFVFRYSVFLFPESLIYESVFLIPEFGCSKYYNLGLHLYEEVGVLTLAVEVSGSS